MATQPRATIGQTFEQLTPLWDDLCRRAGLTRQSGGDLHELEHDAQRFIHTIELAVRGKGARPSSAPPIAITKNGAWW